MSLHNSNDWRLNCRICFWFAGLCLLQFVGCETKKRETPQAKANELLNELLPKKDGDGSIQVDSIASRVGQLLETTASDASADRKPTPTKTNNDAILKIESLAETQQRVVPVEDDPSIPWMLDLSEPLQEWELMYRANVPVGYSTKRTFQSKLADKSIKTELTSVTRVSKGGKTLKQILRITTVEKTNGALVSLTASLELGKSKRELIASVDETRLSFVLNVDGTKQTDNHAAPILWRDDFRGPFAIEQSLLRKPLKDKEARLVRHLDPLTGRVVETRLEALGRHKTPNMKGKSVPLREIRVVTRDGDQITESKIWTNDEGAILKSYNPQLDLRAFHVDEERVQEFSLASDLNLVESIGMPFALKGILNTTYDEMLKQADQVVYRLQLRDEDPYHLISRRTNQRVKSIDAFSSHATVFRLGPNGELPSGVDRQDPVLSADLAQSSWLDIGSVQLDKLYLKSTSHTDLNDRKARVQQIAKKLFENYETVGFDKQVRRVSVSLNGNKLNPVEHAMALIAVLRKDKIPCRMALGLVYNQSDTKPQFVIHAWGEYHHEDRWNPIDSSSPIKQDLLDRIKLKEVRDFNKDLLIELVNIAKLCASGSVSLVE